MVQSHNQPAGLSRLLVVNFFEQLWAPLMGMKAAPPPTLHQVLSMSWLMLPNFVLSCYCLEMTYCSTFSKPFKRSFWKTKKAETLDSSLLLSSTINHLPFRWSCTAAFWTPTTIVCRYYTRRATKRSVLHHLWCCSGGLRWSAALSPPQRGWEMLLKMEFTLVHILPSVAASRLSRAF